MGRMVSMSLRQSVGFRQSLATWPMTGLRSHTTRRVCRSQPWGADIREPTPESVVSRLGRSLDFPSRNHCATSFAPTCKN